MLNIKKIKYQPFLVWLMFLIIALIIFNKLLGNFFVSDDWHWLWLAKETDLSLNIFLTNYEGTTVGGSYNPVLLLLFMSFFKLFGLKYFFYHSISLLIHVSSAFLVYLLAKQIFKLIKITKTWAIVAGLLWLLWPTHVETIAWLAAWPHLWSTFFSLFSLLFYFKFRLVFKKKHLYLSLLFFILALFIKEIAIGVLLVILLWEFYLSEERRLKKILKVYHLSLWTIAIIFFTLRFAATKTLFGYYGSSSLGFSIREWLANTAGYFNELVSAGYLREFFFKLWYYHLDSVAIILAVVLALYFYLLFIKKKHKTIILFSSFLLALLPVLPLGLHRTTFAGERYLYLSSVFFVIWLVYLIARLSFNNRIKMLLLVVIIASSLIIINEKNFIWQTSGKLSKQIVESYQRLDIDKGQQLMTVALPDNLSGAEVFRNNLQQALQFYYSDNYPEILSLPVYLQLTYADKNAHLLEWRKDEMGWFARSTDGGYVVTGQTSIIVHDMYFELWNYNYQNYTANIIRLIPNEILKEKLADGTVKILTFDWGALRIIK